MSNEVEVQVTVDLDLIDITDLTDYLESADYKVFSMDEDGAREAFDWLQEDHEDLISDAEQDVKTLIDTNGVDYVLDCIPQSDLLEYMYRTFTPDQIMGPIESTDVITHLEDSIEAMVIRKLEEPTVELCNVFLKYLETFNWTDIFIKLMKNRGVKLEEVLRAYMIR